MIRLVRALAARVLVFLATVTGAAAAALALLAWAPGDPIALLPNADEVRPLLEAEWALDRPLPERIVRWIGRAATGDLGVSVAYRPGMAVRELLAGPALATLGWWLAALLVAVAWGAGLAAFTAGRPGAWRHVVRWTSAVPVFLLAHLLVHAIDEVTWSLVQAGTIARPSWFALPDQPSDLRTALAVLVLAVGSGTLAEVHAEVEDVVVGLRGSGFVDAARARGMPVLPHLLRNLVAPVATVAANRAAALLGGVVIVEKVLLLNGAGAILWSAAELRDYDVVLGVTVGAAALVGLARLLADAVRLAWDPRLRAEVA